MTADPLRFEAEVSRADERLLATLAALAALDDNALAAPSLLPGWTRGHVLTHIARNADGYVNLLTWARTGVETPMYPGPERRDADIGAGAGRPLAEQVADVTAAAERFAAAVREMPPAAWANPVRHLTGRVLLPPQLVWGRLRELEVHHVDLDAGYGPGDWSEAFTLHLLREIVGDLSGPPLRLSASDLPFVGKIGADAAPLTVRGPARALAAWLIGRSSGDPLRVEPPGPLPPVPTWK